MISLYKINFIIFNSNNVAVSSFYDEVDFSKLNNFIIDIPAVVTDTINFELRIDDVLLDAYYAKLDFQAVGDRWVISIPVCENYFDFIHDNIVQSKYEHCPDESYEDKFIGLANKHERLVEEIYNILDD